MKKQFMPNKLKSLPIAIGLMISIFALIAVFGFSVITGNSNQSKVGITNASAQEPADKGYIDGDNIVIRHNTIDAPSSTAPIFFCG